MILLANPPVVRDMQLTQTNIVVHSSWLVLLYAITQSHIHISIQVRVRSSIVSRKPQNVWPPKSQHCTAAAPQNYYYHWLADGRADPLVQPDDRRRRGPCTCGGKRGGWWPIDLQKWDMLLAICLYVHLFHLCTFDYEHCPFDCFQMSTTGADTEGHADRGEDMGARTEGGGWCCCCCCHMDFGV